MYAFADKAIKDMNRRNLRAFGRLKTLKFDEVNVMREVSKTYDESVRLAKKRYLSIALRAYIAALKRAGSKKDETDDITKDWLLDMMEEYDPVTLYKFTPETERKKQRTVEGIMSAHNKNEVIDRSLRLWTLQIAHYADKSVDKATIDAYKAAGVKKVMWVTEDDDRVCAVCADRDGKIYHIGDIPDKPHYHCRCQLVPVMEDK